MPSACTRMGFSRHRPARGAARRGPCRSERALSHVLPRELVVVCAQERQPLGQAAADDAGHRAHRDRRAGDGVDLAALVRGSSRTRSGCSSPRSSNCSTTWAKSRRRSRRRRRSASPGPAFPGRRPPACRAGAPPRVEPVDQLDGVLVAHAAADDGRAHRPGPRIHADEQLGAVAAGMRLEAAVGGARRSGSSPRRAAPRVRRCRAGRRAGPAPSAGSTRAPWRSQAGDQRDRPARPGHRSTEGSAGGAACVMVQPSKPSGRGRVQRSMCGTSALPSRRRTSRPRAGR
jgi:hypothetical protein